TTTLIYDLRGSQIARLNPRGYLTTTVFDADARPIAEVDALARRTTLVYDVAGERTKKTDGRGYAIAYLFDAAGREQARQYRDGTRVTTIFDSVGQATGWSDANGIWTRTFDGAGQLVKEAAPSHPTGQPLTNLYDPTG